MYIFIKRCRSTRKKKNNMNTSVFKYHLLANETTLFCHSKNFLMLQLFKRMWINGLPQL